MGEIFVRNFGTVRIRGDAPTSEEAEKIRQAMQRQSMTPLGPRPARGRIEGRKFDEGRLGIVPPGARANVREFVEASPDFYPLGPNLPGISGRVITELTPSVLGTAIGGAVGSVAGPLGTLAGASAGSLLGELAAQETGVAPVSDFNMAASGVAPLLGPAARAAGRAVGKVVSFFPGIRSARATVAERTALKNMEEVSSRVIERQSGMAAEPSSALYSRIDSSGIKLDFSSLPNTTRTLNELVRELEPLDSFPEAKRALAIVNSILPKLVPVARSVRLGPGFRRPRLPLPKGGALETAPSPRKGVAPPLTLGELSKVRSFIGRNIGALERAGGLPSGTAKKLFSAINEDIDRLASSGTPEQARAARLVKAAAGRFKLESALGEFENAVAKFTRGAEGSSERALDVNGLLQWLDDVTNPRSARYDKNLTSALQSEIPEIRQSLLEFSKIVGKFGGSKSAAGPGSIVVRNLGAKLGVGVIGAASGGLLAGPVGASVGAILGANTPELLVAVLTSKLGRRLFFSEIEKNGGISGIRLFQIAKRVESSLGLTPSRRAGQRTIAALGAQAIARQPAVFTGGLDRDRRFGR